MSDTLRFSVEEKIETEDGLLAGKGILHYRKNTAIYSVYPPTSYLTLGYWLYLLPPFKPESVLILGYAGGTVAGLIQILYGKDVPITAVDLEIVDNRYNVDLIQADAREFVKTSKKYDCVILDIFDEHQTPDFICEPEFVNEIARITGRFLIVSGTKDALINEAYTQHFARQRLLELNHRIYYFQPTDSRETFFPPIYSFHA